MTEPLNKFDFGVVFSDTTELEEVEILIQVATRVTYLLKKTSLKNLS